MGQGNSAPQKDDGVTWWCKLFARSAAVIAAFVALGLGIMACITLDAACIVGGMWQILVAVVILLLEGSCCFQCWDFLKKVTEFSDRRQYWQKGALYAGSAVFTVVLCRIISTWIGSALIFASGTLYGLMALGKKADKEEMMIHAQKSQGEDGIKLVTAEAQEGE